MKAIVSAACLALGLHGRSVAAAVLDESFADVPLASVSMQQGAPQVFALAVQADGKVIIGGRFDHVAGQLRVEIARLEADGTLDTSFTSPFELTSLSGTIQTLALDAAGGIFVGGTFVLGGALNTLVKLEADGSVDTAFVPEPSLRFLQIGKILLAGNKLHIGTTGGVGLDRLDASGSFDPTFTHFSDASSQSNIDFLIQPSGSLTLGLDEAVVGIGSDGKLASSFTVVPVAYPKLGSLKGGDVLCFANFAEIGASSPNKRFAHIGSNGGIASSFAVPAGVRSFLGVLSGDKILIEQQLPSGESIVRLAPDGTPDDFVVPIDDVVRAIAPYPGDRLMIAGMFGQVENKPRTRVARLLGTSVDGGGAGGSGGSTSASGGSGAAGTGADSGATGDGGAAGDSSTAGDSGAAGTPNAGAPGQGGLSASAGSRASSGGVPTSGGTPLDGSSGGCAFTRPASPSSPLAAWLTIGALALLRVRRKCWGSGAPHRC